MQDRFPDTHSGVEMMKNSLLMFLVFISAKGLVPECGHAAEPCCSVDGQQVDNSCTQSGMTCLQGVCSPCGDDDQPVCTGVEHSALVPFANLLLVASSNSRIES